MTNNESDFKYYHYNPSLPAASIFAILFLLTSLVHIYQLIRSRTWYFTPLVVGGVMECIGYIGRILSSRQSPNWTLGPYIIQSVLILLAPILFAASVYMYLGRLMIATNTTSLSPIRTKWLTKIFVIGDVCCFLIQAIGGGLQSVKSLADTPEIAEGVILAGLVLQIIFFGIFCFVAVLVHRRMARKGVDEKGVAWRRMLLVLYTVSGLITLRNVFRVIEYAMGTDGYLLQNEWPGFVFDGAFMVLALIAVLMSCVIRTR